MLVIDTVARTAGPITTLLPLAGISVRAHFTEAVRRSDADSLENRMTIEDPERFTHPWELTLRYSRVTDMERMIPVDCAADRNPVVNGRLTIAPLAR